MFAFDIDGTIADSYTTLVLYTAQETGVGPGELAPLTHYAGHVARYPEAHRERVEAIMARAYGANEGDVYGAAQPYPGAVEAANYLHARGLFKGYVTRRPERVQAVTRGWLKLHGFPVRPVRFCGDACKSGHVRALCATALVEDAPDDAARAERGGVAVVLVDRPYNRSAAAVRVPDWERFLTFVKALPLDWRVRHEKGF